MARGWLFTISAPKPGHGEGGREAAAGQGASPGQAQAAHRTPGLGLLNVGAPLAVACHHSQPGGSGGGHFPPQQTEPLHEVMKSPFLSDAADTTRSSFRRRGGCGAAAHAPWPRLRSPSRSLCCAGEVACGRWPQGCLQPLLCWAGCEGAAGGEGDVTSSAPPPAALWG